jgi:trehalose synthase
MPEPQRQVDLPVPYRPEPSLSSGVQYLRNYVKEYDASMFSLADFAQPLPHIQYLMPPSIDPLSEKNMDLTPEEVQAAKLQFGLDPDRLIMLQVSRLSFIGSPQTMVFLSKIP